MSQRNSFYRKIAYGAAMAALVFPLFRLSAPRTLKDQGGQLAKLRTEHQLGQADLGDIDPASETMKLATLGLRGVAVNLLWGQANEYKKTENWSKLTATLDQLAKLQPNFITFWKYQSWNQSYNLSVEFDDYRDRYYYVRRGIEFLEEGEKYNHDNPQLLWELGWFVGQKIGRSDEKTQYRRLFRSDEEYHGPRNIPVGRRDNWLVSKDWYLKSVEAADVKGRGIGRKSPLVFYSSAAKSQMNYAEAIEEEGKFDTAEAAWATSEAEWLDFGALGVQHSTGVTIRLAAEEQLAEKAEEVNARLEALLPGVVEELVDEAEAKLSEEERAALKKEPSERSEMENNLAHHAGTHINYTPIDVATRIAEKKPELRRQALQIAAEISELQRLLRFTKSYKQTANYDYWLLRSRFEQTDEAVRARELVFRGKKAFTEELDPIKAKELYEEGLSLWREVIDNYPVLLEGEGITGDDIFVFIKQYNEVLEQLDEEIPDDFELWEIVELFDSDREMVEELAAHQAKMRGATDAGTDAPEGDEAEGDDSESGDSESKEGPTPTLAETPEEDAAPAPEADADEPAADASEESSSDGEKSENTAEPSEAAEPGGDSL